MSRANHRLAGILFCALAAGCAPAGGGSASPGLAGASAARVVPDAGIPGVQYFSGGSGSAGYTVTTKTVSCSGTVRWSGVDVTFIAAGGKVTKSHLNVISLSGSSTGTCNGKHKKLEIPEAYFIKTGTISSSSVNVSGVSPSKKITGSATLTGSLCDATLKTTTYVATSDSNTVNVNPSTIVHIKSSTCT